MTSYSIGLNKIVWHIIDFQLRHGILFLTSLRNEFHCGTRHGTLELVYRVLACLPAPNLICKNLLENPFFVGIYNQIPNETNETLCLCNWQAFLDYGIVVLKIT